MKTPFLGLLDIMAALLMALLLSTATVFAQDTGFGVIYTFKGPPDGSFPLAGLIDIGGVLYGTTAFGGANFLPNGAYCQCGTVFSVTLGGNEHVLHSFNLPHDAVNPEANLTNVGGLLYSTASSNLILTNNYGAVFKIGPFGNESPVYSFNGGRDGDTPRGGLTYFDGKLFGTTTGSFGGDNGTVFSMTLGGQEKPLHVFTGGSDGSSPFGNLLNVSGTIYGAASFGGSNVCAGGCGTVFKIPEIGPFAVVHSFQGGCDGASPNGFLINVGGTIYGTTYQGGGSSNCDGGCGTVFRIMPDGKESVVYAFQGGSDGAGPLAGLSYLGGALYGTTVNGGSANCNLGCGTVFKLTTQGVETVLHSFTDGADGAYPAASMIYRNGTLYGMASQGGLTTCRSPFNGCGTVFALKP